MKPYKLFPLPSVKRVAFLSSMLGVVTGVFLAGALTWPHIQPYSPWPAQKAVAVTPVKVASIDMSSKRAMDLCASAVEETAKLRKDMADWMRAKTAPSKTQPIK